MRKWFLLFASLLALDIGTKIWAIESIPRLSMGPYPFGGIGVFSFGGISCSFNYIVNSGAAWGAFAGYSGLLFGLRACIIAFLIFFVPKKPAVWLIITGAIGNAIDYCLYGHVIDFIHFNFFGYSFPIFNVADSCITLGVLYLLFFSSKAKAVRIL